MATRRDPDREQKATSLELFYDLVFVFAITQLSHHLVSNLDWRGLGQSTLILLVVWWSWNYTTWVTNELDPGSSAVRLLMMVLMLLSLLMAVAIPEAFGSRALLFTGSYVAIQTGRHLFLTLYAADPGSPERERAGRILAWFAFAGVFWIAGALADGAARTALWLVALALDYGAPLVLFYIPGRDRLTSAAWSVETGHFSERFGLFIIIALGESIVVTGTTVSGLRLDTATVAAFAVAFLATAALWWLYFTAVQEIAERRLEESEDRTTVARDAYTYLHVVLVAGIIVAAVGDELVLKHPRASLGAAEVAAIVGGPALYLFAHALFRLRLAGTLSRRRLTGAAACVAAGLVASAASSLVVATLVLVVLGTVVALDERQRDGEHPLEMAH